MSAGRADSGRALLGIAGWSYVMDGGQQAIGLIVTFVLAALLGPAVFGLSAMATVYIMFIDLMQRQGMASALIQRKELTPEHKDTGFWLVMSASLVMMAVGMAGAGWWANVNDTPELQPVIIALSPLVVLQGLTTVQTALLRRDMAFRALAKRTIAAVIAGGVVGMAGAALGWGVYALVAQQLVFGTVSVLVLWSVSDWRPRLRFSIAAARDLLGFSTGAFLSSLAVFVNNRADALLIGLFFGPVVVGVYRLGSRLVDVLLAGLVRPLTSLALPELAPHQGDQAELRRRLQRLMQMSSVISLPALGLLAAIAGPLTDVLGDGWVGAAPVIRVLCLVGAVRVITSLDAPLLQAVGSPFVQAAVSWLAAGISAATFVATGLVLAGAPASDQALGIAWSRAAVYGLAICTIHVILMRRTAGVYVRRGPVPFGRPAAIAMATAVVGLMAASAIPATLPFIRLIAAVFSAVLVGGMATWRWTPGLTELAGTISRRRRRATVPG